MPSNSQAKLIIEYNQRDYASQVTIHFTSGVNPPYTCDRANLIDFLAGYFGDDALSVIIRANREG